MLRHLGSVVLVLTIVGVVQAADPPGKEVNFPNHQVKFTVPKGWQVVKSEIGKDYAWCVLQTTGAAQIKSTITIWAGDKYIKEAPEFGNVKKGTTVSASVWAAGKAVAWATNTRDKKPVLLSDDVIIGTGSKYNDVSYWQADMKNKTLMSRGLSADKRDGGALTIGLATGAGGIENAMKTVAEILEKK